MKCQAYHIFFSHLANELKNDIIVNLRKKKMNVTELSRVLDVEQSKLSHALASLKCCKVVNVEQKGKTRVYSLNKKTIVPILKLIDKHALLNCESDGCSCEDKES